METTNAISVPSVNNPTLPASHPPVFMQTSELAATVKTEVTTRIAGSTPGTSGNAATSLISSSIPPSSIQTAGLSAAKSGTVGSSSDTKLLDKRRITDLLKEVDPLEQLDDDVEELLTQIADDFIDNVVTSACQLARHRKSGTVEVKDVQLHLERHWNMWIPGFGSEELRPYKKQATTEAHRQRLALIKKTLKKS